jgi:tetratricopeptide (TPR) repeat protein
LTQTIFAQFLTYLGVLYNEGFEYLKPWKSCKFQSPRERSNIMRRGSIYQRHPSFTANLPVCLILIVLLFGCKDKSEEISSEQHQKNTASKEQKQQASVKDARTIELVLHPAKAPEPTHKYRLLPKAEEQTDADAVSLYEKAIQLLPENTQTDQVSQWLKIPSNELPIQQAQSTLQQFDPTMELIKQAVKCKKCDWPYWDDETSSQNLSKFRRIIFLLDLQARIQVAQGDYDKAIDTIQTGFTMAKHIDKGITLLHGLIGVAISARMCRPLEQFIQQPDAPNLYWALRDLPQPLIDLTERSEHEDQDIRDKMRLLMNRLDRNMAALQCVEAIRLYAAAHNGKFPNELSDITQVPVPNNPATQKPLIYKRTGAKAFLEAPDTKEQDKHATRYELSLKE